MHFLNEAKAKLQAIQEELVNAKDNHKVLLEEKRNVLGGASRSGCQRKHSSRAMDGCS